MSLPSRSFLGSCWLLVAAAVSLLSCAPRNPPRWAEGGAELTLPAARWDRESGDPVEIRPDGHVLVDGDLKFVIDRVGRVADDDYEPYAVLLPDGQLAGVDNMSLGRVGVNNASPPGGVEAWLSVAPDGRVTYFDADGARRAERGAVAAARRSAPARWWRSSWRWRIIAVRAAVSALV